jgi:hypothetical protein
VEPQDSPAAAPHASRPYRPPHQLPIAAVPAAEEAPSLTPLLEAEADQASARLLAMLIAEIPRHVALAASLQRFKFLTHDDLDELTAKIARAAVRHSEKAKDYCRSDKAMLSYAMRCVRNFVIEFVKLKLRRSTAEEAFASNTEEASARRVETGASGNATNHLVRPAIGANRDRCNSAMMMSKADRDPRELGPWGPRRPRIEGRA